MNIKTNLLEEYVNFVDSTKQQTKFLWICTIILIFIVIILVILRVFRYNTNWYLYKHKNIHICIGVIKLHQSIAYQSEIK